MPNAESASRALAIPTIAPAPGGVLALDLSSHVGWAYGPVGARVPLFGTWHLPKEGGEGARYAAFENTLATTIEAVQPARMILEGHLPIPAMNNVRSTRQQLGLRAFAYSEAYRASVAISEIDVLTVRMETMGRAHFPTGEVKQHVMAFCRRQLGWDVDDDNAADACLVWLWHSGRQSNRRGGPLFVAGRA